MSGKNQAFQKSIIAYIGAVIGIISQLWIYPLAFEVYGDFQFILAMITFFTPWASLGILGLNNRFYPYFENETNGNSFFTLQLLALGSAFLFFLFFVTLFEEQYFTLIKYVGFQVDVFKKYNDIILSSVFFSIVLTFLSHYSVNLRKIVMPYFSTVFSWKIILPFLIILFVSGWISKVTFFTVLPFVYAVLTILMMFYIHSIRRIKFSLRVSKALKDNARSMLWFAGYGILSSYGYILAYTIDRIMIRGYTTDYDTGVYSMMVVLSGVILYPYDSIISVSTPKIAKKWKENDVLGINVMNRQATNILALVTPFVFVLAYLNLNDIAGLTSNADAFRSGINAFFFLGIAKVINGVMGLNALTLNFSKNYYVLFFTTLLLGVINVYLNSILIPEYGMTGAAVASLVALVSTNFIVYIYNRWKFSIQPFTVSVMYTLVTIVVATLIAKACVFTSFPFVNIIIRSLVFVLLSLPIIYYFRWIPDFNQAIKKLISKYH